MRRPLLFALFLLCAGFGFAPTAWAGPEVSVPRVEGLDLELAAQRLESAHLQVAITWTAEGKPGRVQTQYPAHGTPVSRGTIVELAVTRRVKVETIVPDIVGLDEEEAVAALEDVYVLEMEERPVHRRRIGKVVGTEPAAGARLSFGGVLRLFVGRRERRSIEFPLPDVQHILLNEAESILLDQGLVPVPTFVRTRHGAQGRVRRQDPEPGARVTYGTRVALEVGVARDFGRRVRLPSLYGLDPTEAARALDALGLKVSVERLPSRFAQDTVIRQLPQAGTGITAGSAVRIVVAFPAARTHVPARVQVPSLEGRSLAEAFARARRAGIQLDVYRSRRAGHGVPDVVLTQRPTAHAAVPLGTRVRIEVPSGTTVPDLVGLAPDVAALRVWEAGLRLELEGRTHRRPGALVVTQSPEAGTLVAADTVVRALLARDAGVGLVLVPALAGLTVTDAQARLRTAGLHAQLSGPPVPAGARTRVVTQLPTVGARVPRGSTVQVAYRLALDESHTLTVVPDLRGRSLRDAHRLLLVRGLEGVASTVRGPGPKGVTGQDPAPGTRVRRGVKVRFTVRR